MPFRAKYIGGGGCGHDKHGWPTAKIEAEESDSPKIRYFYCLRVFAWGGEVETMSSRVVKLFMNSNAKYTVTTQVQTQTSTQYKQLKTNNN